MTVQVQLDATTSTLGRAALWYALHLGWRVFPVWSLDWYRDPSGTLQRVVDAIELAKVDVGKT